MRHPPYHLRANKGVDRVALVEAILRLSGGQQLSEYTYYGLGGPFLEEYRLLYATCPELRMVSVENNEEIYKRQDFHLPCGVLELRHEEFSSFLRQYDAEDRKSIFWVDNTDLKYDHIDSFIALLQKVSPGSLVKISLQAEPQYYQEAERKRSFRGEFDEVLPHGAVVPTERGRFAALLQDIVQIAAQRAFRGIEDRTFQPVSSLYYKDGAGMFTIAGVVCETDERPDVRRKFEGWQFANLDWAAPTKIDLPDLSTKERLKLQKFLPRSTTDAGLALHRALGYLIDEDAASTRRQLKQWALYHRQAAHFVRAMP